MPEIQKYVERKLAGYNGDITGMIGAIRRDLQNKFGVTDANIFVGWSPDHTFDVACIKITINTCVYAAYKNLMTGERL